MELFTSIVLYTSLFCGLYFQIFVLVTFLEDEGEETKDTQKMPHSSFPTVSITVPCFNEALTVEKTIASLLGLDYPADKLSILVVDDGSSDNTFGVASLYAEKIAKSNRNRNIQVIRQKNGGKYTALNYGIKTSTAEFIGCLDADSTVDPQALRRMIPLFAQSRVMAVTPAMRVHEPRTILQYMQKVEYEVGVFAKKVFGKMDALHVTPGPFSIFRRSVFAKIGPFRHAHNTEDMEIACRIQKHGYQIKNCATAFVETITPNTFKKLHRQRTRWVYGFIQNSIDYKDMFFNKKYGNIGTFTLPFASISIVSAVLLLGIFIYNCISNLIHLIERYTITGFHISLTPSLAHMNWFYLNTQSFTLLAVVLFVIGISVMLIGKKMSNGTMRPSLDMLYFIALYGFISPIWLGKGLYNSILSRKTPWR